MKLNNVSDLLRSKQLNYVYFDLVWIFLVLTFLPSVHRYGLAVFSSPHDLGCRESIRLTHQADVLVLPDCNRWLRALIIQDVRWNCTSKTNLDDLLVSNITTEFWHIKGVRESKSWTSRQDFYNQNWGIVYFFKSQDTFIKLLLANPGEDLISVGKNC